MRWPWQKARPIEPRRASVSSKALELQAAMEILAEVFGTQPGEVEEMIQRRLEERTRIAYPILAIFAACLSILTAAVAEYP